MESENYYWIVIFNTVSYNEITPDNNFQGFYSQMYLVNRRSWIIKILNDTETADGDNVIRIVFL